MIPVKYIDSVYNKETRKVEKIAKYGFWRGGKVILMDKEHTTVRNWKWVKIAPVRMLIYLAKRVKIEFNIVYKNSN